jgi:hypothetical protein
MTELLPTPRAQMGSTEQPSADRPHKGGGRPRRLEVEVARTSPSSPTSEGWISRWKRRGIPASDRSSGMPTAPESSNDGGRLFPVGEMSPDSGLLPTPTAGDSKSSGNRGNPENNAHDGLSLTDAVRPDRHGHRLTSSPLDSPVSPPPPPADGREPPMTAGSGRRSPVSLASYDPELSSWRTSQVSLLSTEDERFPRSSERWPTSGMTRRGRAFALPMSERATSASGSSSLPTPASRDWKGDNGRAGTLPNLLHTPTTGDTVPNYDHRASPGYTRAIPVPNLAAQIEDELLPTPRHEGFDAGNHRGQPDSLNQTIRMLPTPKTPTGGSEARAGRKARGSGGEDLAASIGELTSPPSEGGSE